MSGSSFPAVVFVTLLVAAVAWYWLARASSSSASDGDFVLNLTGWKRFENIEQIPQLVVQQARIIGAQNHHTPNTSLLLADSLKDGRKVVEAEQLLRDLLDDREKTIGLQDHERLEGFLLLAETLEDQGRFKEAERLLRDVLIKQEQSTAAQGFGTIIVLFGLARNLEKQLKMREAGQNYQKILRLEEIMSQTAAVEHPVALQTLWCLGMTHVAVHQYSEAEQIFREIFGMRKKIHGVDDPQTLRDLFSLAHTLRSQEKYQEAEQVYRELAELERQGILLKGVNPGSFERYMISARLSQMEEPEAGIWWVKETKKEPFASIVIFLIKVCSIISVFPCTPC
ncbi:hypothetical protein N7475_000354 [Penicillium sp. IBT 31633x]|nr:hypothetical protein N7475_000354 [Penicillium sp. IBT 31633x]